jgi:DNA-binding CsgD family transcriptional regulator
MSTPHTSFRLDAALTVREVWRATRAFAIEALGCRSVEMHIGSEKNMKVFRHSQPAAESAALLPGSSESSGQRRRRLRISASKGRETLAYLEIARGREDPPFSIRERRIASSLQPFFEAALRRALIHEEEVRQVEQFAAILEYVPIGLLILDWDLKPIWRNNEAANVCAVWNRGEREAFTVIPWRAFQVPQPLAKACLEARNGSTGVVPRAAEPRRKPRLVVDAALGIHAQVELRRVGSAYLRPVFLIHLDYRRPRGDRNRRISKGALAILDRLSVREREVAMGLREGMRNAEIAATMRVSPLTIKAQLASIYSKMGVHGRTHAAILLNR